MKQRSAFFSSVLTGVLVLALAGLLFGQGQDRGVITGLVADRSGAAVQEATVTLTNTATGVKTVVSTSSAGNFTTPPLVLGTYKVEVEKAGFKTFVHPGIVVATGTVRMDATLDVGQVSETVEVQASNVEINVTNPEVTQVLGEKYYRDLPVVMGADIRLAESLLEIGRAHV